MRSESSWMRFREQCHIPNAIMQGMKPSVRAILVIASVVPALFAHDLYILPESFRFDKSSRLQVAFHNGDAFPQSESAPRPERLKNYKLSWNGGSMPVSNLHVVGQETIGDVVISTVGSYILSVETTPNLIELAPDKFAEYLKEEGLANVIEWRNLHSENARPGKERYTKFAKSLLQWAPANGFYNHAMNFPIEIIPLADPYTLHPGGRLPVRVLVGGKPAGGLQMDRAWSAGSENKTMIVGKTAEDGVTEIPLEKAGKYRLHTLKMDRCSEPAVADWESLWASLTFEVQ